MFGLDDALLYGKAGISIIPSIVDVVKKLRETEDAPAIQRVIDQLVTDTREECKKLSEETRAIERSLRDLKVDPKKTLSEITEDLKWYDLIAKYSLGRHKKNLREIEEKLSSSVDDFVSILVCAGRVPDLKTATSISQAIRRDLDGLSEQPIEDVLESYRQIIDRYVNELH